MELESSPKGFDIIWVLQVGLSLHFEPRSGCPALSPSKILKAARGLSQQLLSGSPAVRPYIPNRGVTFPLCSSQMCSMLYSCFPD